MASRTPSLDSLPDELLGACLSYLAPQDGRELDLRRYVTAVNKRLRRLFFEQPSLWRSLQLPTLTTSEQLEAKLALLRRVAPLLSAFTVEPNSWQGSEWNLDGSSGHLPLNAFLQLLPPSLTALALGTRADPLELPPATVQLLRPFTALRSLSLHCLMEAGALPAALQHMPHLEQLDCRVQRSPDLQPLTQLSQLRRLQLRDCGGSVDSGLRLPVLAALPQLEHFEVESFSQELVEVADTRCAGCYMRPSLFGNDDSADQQAVMSLHIRNAQPLGSLQSLLSAVVRPNLTPQALELEQVSVSAEALEGCTQLTALKRLRLCSCVCDAAAAAALFAASRHLTSLDLVCWDGPAFAALNLQLPPQLKRLCIVDYGFCLPLELEQVSGLEILDVSCSFLLQLREEDLLLLARLPNLRELGLPGRDLNDLMLDNWADGVLEETRETVQAIMRQRPSLRIWYQNKPYFDMHSP